MEQKRVKKKSGLFRSVSSLSTSSRRNQTDSENERENNLERIRLSIGRRSVEDFSNHPISEIWNENENRQSPTNILEPVFEDTLPVLPSAPPEPADNVFGPDFDDATAPAESEEENQRINYHDESHEDNEDHVTNEEEEIIEILKSSQNSTQSSSQNHHSPSKSRNSSFRNQNTSHNDEPFLLTSPPPPQSSAVCPPAPSKSSVSKIPSMNTPSSIPSSSSAVFGSDTKCVICLENGKDIVFQPCWHQVTCSECAIRLKECPICREVIAVRRRPYRC